MNKNPWLSHVKKYHKKHPKLTYKECLQKAKRTYKSKKIKQKGGNFNDILKKIKLQLGSMSPFDYPYSFVAYKEGSGTAKKGHIFGRKSTKKRYFQLELNKSNKLTLKYYSDNKQNNSALKGCVIIENIFESQDNQVILNLSEKNTNHECVSGFNNLNSSEKKLKLTFDNSYQNELINCYVKLYKSIQNIINEYNGITKLKSISIPNDNPIKILILDFDETITKLHFSKSQCGISKSLRNCWNNDNNNNFFEAIFNILTQLKKKGFSINIVTRGNVYEIMKEVEKKCEKNKKDFKEFLNLFDVIYGGAYENDELIEELIEEFKKSLENIKLKHSTYSTIIDAELINFYQALRKNYSNNFINPGDAIKKCGTDYIKYSYLWGYVKYKMIDKIRESFKQKDFDNIYFLDDTEVNIDICNIMGVKNSILINNQFDITTSKYYYNNIINVLTLLINQKDIPTIMKRVNTQSMLDVQKYLGKNIYEQHFKSLNECYKETMFKNWKANVIENLINK